MNGRTAALGGAIFGFFTGLLYVLPPVAVDGLAGPGQLGVFGAYIATCSFVAWKFYDLREWVHRWGRLGELAAWVVALNAAGSVAFSVGKLLRIWPSEVGFHWVILGATALGIVLGLRSREYLREVPPATPEEAENKSTGS